jgi:hypothetical protein
MMRPVNELDPAANEEAGETAADAVEPVVWAGAVAGARIVRIDLVATGVFLVTAAAAAATTATWVRAIATSVALGLFAAGCLAFLWAYGIAVKRSRTHEMGIGGLFLLLRPTAPASVQRVMNGALVAQVAIGLATSSVRASERPFTTLAFGLLVPVLGIGLNGQWAARHGHFGARIVPERSDSAGHTVRTPRPPMKQNARHG